MVFLIDFPSTPSQAPIGGLELLIGAGGAIGLQETQEQLNKKQFTFSYSQGFEGNHGYHPEMFNNFIFQDDIDELISTKKITPGMVSGREISIGVSDYNVDTKITLSFVIGQTEFLDINGQFSDLYFIGSNVWRYKGLSLSYDRKLLFISIGILESSNEMIFKSPQIHFQIGTNFILYRKK